MKIIINFFKWLFEDLGTNVYEKKYYYDGECETAFIIQQGNRIFGIPEWKNVRICFDKNEALKSIKEC